MATKLQVFVLVRATMNAPSVWASPVWYSCQCECGLTWGNSA